MPLSGSNLAFFTKNITFSGFNQKVKVDARGNVQTNYVILDTDNTGSQLYQTYMVDMASGRLRFAGRSIHFPGGSPPPSDSSCWFDKSAICTGGECFFNFMHFSVHILLSILHYQDNYFTLRCRDNLHRGGAGCHRGSGFRRSCFKFLRQVQI